MTRLLLPPRRRSENVYFRCRNRSYIATVGYYPDHRPGEIFLVSSRPGTDADIAARDLGIAASLALQHGCSASVLKHACLRDELSGTLEGPLGVLLSMLEGADVG